MFVMGLGEGLIVLVVCEQRNKMKNFLWSVSLSWREVGEGSLRPKVIPTVHRTYNTWVAQ